MVKVRDTANIFANAKKVAAENRMDSVVLQSIIRVFGRNVLHV